MHRTLSTALCALCAVTLGVHTNWSLNEAQQDALFNEYVLELIDNFTAVDTFDDHGITSFVGTRITDSPDADVFYSTPTNAKGMRSMLRDQGRASEAFVNRVLAMIPHCHRLVADNFYFNRRSQEAVYGRVGILRNPFDGNDYYVMNAFISFPLQLEPRKLLSKEWSRLAYYGRYETVTGFMHSQKHALESARQRASLSQRYLIRSYDKEPLIICPAFNLIQGPNAGANHCIDRFIWQIAVVSILFVWTYR